MLSRVSKGLLEDKRSDIDLDSDIKDQYDIISSGLETLKNLLSESDALDAESILEPASDQLREEINEVLQEQEEHRADQEDDGDWDVFSPSKPTPVPRDEKRRNSLRSIFVDVDRV
jgi:uncharacterized protein (DUF2267 family)